MPAAREEPEHPPTISVVARFPENFSVDDDNSVSPEHPTSWVVLCNFRGFCCRDAKCVFRRGFSHDDIFCGIAGNDGEYDSRLLKQLTATWRGRGEDEGWLVVMMSHEWKELKVKD